MDAKPDPLANMTFEVTLDGLVEDLVRMKAYHRDAHQAATLVMAETYVKIIDQVFAKHHDTNRYINGYISALHDLDIGQTIPMKPYKKSSRHDDWIEKLKEQYKGLLKEAEQVERLMKLAEQRDATDPPRLDGKPRKKRVDQPWYRAMQRKLMKIHERRERAFETLMEAVNNDGFLMIHGRAGKKLKNGQMGLSRLSEVRSQFYGGHGRLTLLGEQVIIELHNLEPHSRIIETRPGYGFPHKTALLKLSVLGAKSVSDRYIKHQSYLFNRRFVTAGEIRAHNANRHTILFKKDA